MRVSEVTGGLFAPKGLKDSAWGFDPRNRAKPGGALKGRKMF
jgi:hypothetical protein